MLAIYVMLAAITTLWTVGSAVALVATRRRAARAGVSNTAYEASAFGSGAHWPASTLRVEPISVLKPLCGVDDDLEANLRSFFEQSHPRFEVVFGVEGESDEALPLVRALCREYPEVQCQVVVHEGGPGLNPKVRNLSAMAHHARHGILVVSDSNVAVPPSYLREVARELSEPEVGLLTHLIAPDGAANIGAATEALHLAGVVAGQVALTTRLGHPVVMGKSMAFRRPVLEQLGGFESVRDVLAEDYVLGRMVHLAGYEVRLARSVVWNVRTRASLWSLFDRQLRWAMIRSRLQPLAYLLEPLSVPLFVAAAAPLFGAPLVPMLAGALALTVARDAVQWVALRGRGGLVLALPLAPLRDALTLAAWLAAPVRKRIAWRGRRLRVSAGTRLFQETPVAAT